MNAKSLIVLAAFAAAAGSVLADDITPDNTAAVASTRSRASVASEVRQARAAGQLLAAGEVANSPSAAVPTTLSRTSVKADVLAARSQDALMPAGELLVAEHAVPRPDGSRLGDFALSRR